MPDSQTTTGIHNPMHSSDSSSPIEPEDPLVLNFGYSVLPDPESRMAGESWAQRLSAASGLNAVAKPGPSTDMEILQAMRDGKIHMAVLSPLAFTYGLAQGWVIPGLVETYTYQPSSSVMFVARTDSGLAPGELPRVFQQLVGKRPCWPDIEDWPEIPVLEYILPAGLLAQARVELEKPTFVTHTSAGWNEVAAVFSGECDFAVMKAESIESFLTSIPDELFHSGVTFTDWEEQMQVLYTTQPIEPMPVLAYSANLDSSTREKLSNAILHLPAYYPEYSWIPYNEEQIAYYEQFKALVDSSGVDIADYLNRPWGLQEYINTTFQQSPIPTIPATVNPNAIVVDVALTDSGSPWLPFSQSSNPLNRLILPAIYAELVRMDGNGNYFPYLAQELPTFENGLVRLTSQGQDEQLEVEFHLRPGVIWQDGTPLTADDLVFSWKLVMQPNWPGSHYNGTNFASEIYVQDVQALAPDRVVYRFMSQHQASQAALTGGKLGKPSLYTSLSQQEGPVVPLEYLNVGRNVFPKHLLENIPAGEVMQSDFALHPVYAGAYRLVQGGETGKPVVLEAFNGFVLGAPSIQQVVFGAIYSLPQASTYWQSPTRLADALQSGAVQAQLGLPGVNSRQGEDPHAYDTLSSQGLAKVDWVGRNGWETLDFNLDNPHLADLKVRQAIAHAIDRQAIIDLALSGHGSLMHSYLPNWHPYYAGDGALPDYNFDPEQARSLLRQAGYDLSQFPAVHPLRGPLVLNLDSMDVASYPRPATADLIKQELAAIGIQVNVQFYSFAEFEGQDCTAVRNGRRFDLGMAGWIGLSRYDTWYAEHVTASWSIPTAENGCPFENANWSGWRNTRADEIIPQLENGRLELENPGEYKGLWVEHQQLWASDLPSLPLFNWQRPVVTVPGLNAVLPSPFFSEGTDDTWNIFQWVWR